MHDIKLLQQTAMLIGEFDTQFKITRSTVEFFRSDEKKTGLSAR
jgi:hypothetical protein